MDDTLKDIIQKASKGDIQAFEQLYRSFGGYVYNVALRMLRNHEDAQEITQEVFLLVYRKLDSYKFESSFKTWIYRIAVNSSLDFLRKYADKRQKTAQYDENASTFAVTGTIEDKLDQEYYTQLTLKLFDRLPSEQRACMVLRHMEGLNYQEIADVLQININTVRTRLKRSREFFLSMEKEVINNEL